MEAMQGKCVPGETEYKKEEANEFINDFTKDFVDIDGNNKSLYTFLSMSENECKRTNTLGDTCTEWNSNRGGSNIWTTQGYYVSLGAPKTKKKRARGPVEPMRTGQ